MFAKLHLLSQDTPAGEGGLRWRAHPYLRMDGARPRGPAVFDWNERQREDLEALWRDPTAEGARERLARDLAVFCDELGWAPEAKLLEDAEAHGDEYLLTLSAVPAELYVLPWEVIQVGAAGTYLSDYANAQVRYAVPGLEPRQLQAAPPRPGVLFAWSGAGGAVPHQEQAAAIRAAAEAGGVAFRELAEVDEGSLQAALDDGPLSVLHLLCHGLPGAEGEPPRLRWGASDSPSEITATRLARMLRRHHGTLRLVVLSSCGSGDGRGDPLLLSSMAQELHRKGIPNVVASRYPLSVAGARVLTRALYDRMLREAWSLERALRATREALLRVDDDGESHAGDAYGIQLYAQDTERFRSDNELEAERPVLASYPFGTAARPVPASGPPTAELTLDLDADPGLSEEELTGKLRRVSEDDEATVAARPAAGSRACSLIVRTTVDGAQRLLGAWRSKVLQTAVGVIVGELIVTKGLLPALAAPASSAPTAASAGKAAAATGKTAAVVTGKAAAAIAGKGLVIKLAIFAVIGSAAAAGGVAVYRAQARPDEPAAPAAPAALITQELPIAGGSTSIDAGPRDAVAISDASAEAAGVAPSFVDAGPVPEVGSSVAPPPPAKRAPAAAKAPSSKVTSPPEEAVTIAIPPPPPPDAKAPSTEGAPSSKDASPPEVAVDPTSIPLKLVLTLKKGVSTTIYRSKNYGQGTAVGFIVPKQATASGPQSLVTGTKPGSVALSVVAKARSTGKDQPLPLRGIRSTHCGEVAMHLMNASLTCGGGKEQSILILTIRKEDLEAMPEDLYTGSLQINAQRWPGRGLVEKLMFTYELSIER